MESTSQQDLHGAFFEDMMAKEAIREALLRYCRGIDRRDFDTMRSAYHSDAYDHHGGYNGGIAGLIAWAEKRHEGVEQSMHMLGNMDIRVAGSAATVETYCVVYQRLFKDGAASASQLGFTAGEPGAQTATRCRFLDKFECRDGDWRIAHRRVVYESVSFEDSERGMPWGPALTVARRDRDDASYEHLR